MHEFIDKFIQYGYILLFLYSLGGGMLALLTVGVFANAYNINPYISMSVACLGNFIGSTALFYFTRQSRKDINKYLIKYKRKVAYLIVMFRKHSFIFTLVCKFIYGLKTLGPIAAELSKLNLIKFSIYNIISCIIWSIVVFYVASYLGSGLEKFLNKYDFSWIIFIILVIVFLLYFKRNKNEEK